MALLEALLRWPSSSSTALLGALLLLLLLYNLSSWFLGSRSDRKEPPGPKPLPIIGNMLLLSQQRPPDMLRKLRQQYGTVFTFHMGLRKVVMLSGYKTVKEALIKNSEEFGERQPMFNVEGFRLLESVFKVGLVWTNGDNWREMRRFALSSLRDYGMGKRASEDKVIEECHHLMEVFRKAEGKPLEVTQPITLAISNIICSMVYGRRFDYEDPWFSHMVHRMTRIFEILGSPWMQVFSSFSFAKWLLPFTEIWLLFYKFYKEDKVMINSLRKTLNPQQPRGLVDAFLLRRQQELDNGKLTYYNNANLMMVILELFAAGTETSSTTLSWALLYMAKYSKTQEQVREEVRNVVGSRQVQVEDRKNLPFTDAVMHECQRLADIGPINLPHRTTKDINFHGYFLKKGTTVYPLLTSCLNDENEWKYPDTFYPGHFLDEDGKFLKKEAFLPFSAGRRACVGEGLARMELFIFFATLLQHFRFTPSPGVSGEDLDLTPRVGLTLCPPMHLLCAHPCM